MGFFFSNNDLGIDFELILLWIDKCFVEGFWIGGGFGKYLYFVWSYKLVKVEWSVKFNLIMFVLKFDIEVKKVL